jgi:hypothetical protein
LSPAGKDDPAAAEPAVAAAERRTRPLAAGLMPRRRGLGPPLLGLMVRSKATLAFAAERQVVGQTSVTPSLKIHGVVAATLLLAFACAHQAATRPPPVACSDETVALRIARDDVRETARAEGTPVTIDESRTSYDAGRASWRFWLLIGTAIKPDKAFLYVRKSDCSIDWGSFLSEM